MTERADTGADEDSVFEFWARVEGDGAFVRVLRRAIEWSLPDEGSGVEVIPMASVIAVSSEPGKFRSTLLVLAEDRNVAFRVDNALAHEAKALIRLLVAVFGREDAHIAINRVS